MATTLKKLRKRVDKLSLDTIREAGFQAAKLSPYDTGENASNIHPALAYERPKHIPLSGSISRNTAVSRTVNRLKRWNPPENAKILSLVATAPHAILLEDGSSQQAPTGFMRNALRRAKAKVFG